MWIIGAIIAFAIALFIQLASANKGVFLTTTTFEIIGFICLSVAHLVPGWWPARRPPG